VPVGVAEPESSVEVAHERECCLPLLVSEDGAEDSLLRFFCGHRIAAEPCWL
jgi:hypothetical protein